MTTRILALALAALAGAAQAATFECTYTESGDETGCTAYDATYTFELDLKYGTGAPVDRAGTFPGTCSLAAGLHHFSLVNDAGAELVTMARSGQSYYSGHMAGEEGLIVCRLSGGCAQR
jgi:hypothetical protein